MTDLEKRREMQFILCFKVNANVTTTKANLATFSSLKRQFLFHLTTIISVQ